MTEEQKAAVSHFDTPDSLSQTQNSLQVSPRAPDKTPQKSPNSKISNVASVQRAKNKAIAF